MGNKIIDVVLRLKDQMTKPLDAANKNMKAHAKEWQRAGRDIQKVGRNVSNAGKSLTRNLTVPIVGAGAASVKCAADFEKGMSDVMAIMGVTGSAAETQRKRLEKNALAMSKNGFAADEVAEAYKYMGMAGWKTGQIMKGTEPILKLAAATNTEVGRTSDIVTDALTAFGAKAKDTARLTDVLATASSNSNTNVEMLGETFKYAAPVAGALGLSMEEVAAASGLMANAGIKASQAGTTLRSTISNISAPTKAAAEMLAKYNLSSKELSDMPLQKQLKTLRETYKGLEKDEKAAFAKAIAGKNAMSGFMAVMKVSDKEFKGFSKTIKDSSGATDRMFKTSTNNLTGQLKVLKAELKNTGVEFGNILLPYIKKAVGGLKSLTDRLKNMTEEEKKHLVKVAAIAAAVGPVLLVLGKVVGIAGKVVSLVGAIGKAGGLLAALSGPGAIVVGVLTAIAAAVGFVVAHWDDLKESVIGCWEAIKPVVDAIGEAFGALFSGISGEAKDCSSGLVSLFKFVFNTIKTIIGWVAPIVTKVIQVVAKVVGRVVGFVKKIIDAVKAIYDKVKPFIEGVYKIAKATIDGILGLVEWALDPILDVVGGIIDAFSGIIDFVTNIFTGKWEEAWEQVKEVFGAIWDGIKGAAIGALNGIIDAINLVLAGIFEISTWVTNLVPGASIPDEVKYRIEDELSTLIPHIPENAKGTSNFIGGLTRINEKGGEIIDLPRGSRIYPHDESVAKAYKDGMMATTSNNITISIPKLADSIVVREDADIDRIATKLAHKLEKVSQNLGGSKIGYSFQS